MRDDYPRRLRSAQPNATQAASPIIPTAGSGTYTVSNGCTGTWTSRMRCGSVAVSYRNRYGRTRQYSTHYEGVVPWVERRHTESDSDRVRDVIEGYMRLVACTSCDGARLKPSTLAVTIEGKHIAEVSEMSIADAGAWFQGLSKKLNAKQVEIARRILREIDDRLAAVSAVLLKIGLSSFRLFRGGETR